MEGGDDSDAGARDGVSQRASLTECFSKIKKRVTLRLGVAEISVH